MKKKQDNWASKVPNHEIQALARILLPEIEKFYATEEGRKEFEEWKKAQAEKEDTRA